MSSESVCQVARSWVDVGSSHTHLVVRFMIFTASVRSILDAPSYNESRAVHNYRYRLEGSPLCRIRHMLRNNSKALGKVVTYILETCSMCLINHHAMKTYGGMEVQLQTLISVLDRNE
jgi:hypothetical protein